MPETVAMFTVASDQPGLGGTLRIVLLASIVGAGLFAWFLLRGYRDKDNNE
jgi:hypothetical protein